MFPVEEYPKDMHVNCFYLSDQKFLFSFRYVLITLTLFLFGQTVIFIFDISTLLSSKFDIWCKFAIFFHRDNVLADCFQGFFVVTCTLCAFISLVWLREQILHGGGPDWLDFENHGANAQQVRQMN